MKMKISIDEIKITDTKTHITNDNRTVVSLTLKKNTSYTTKFVRG